MWNDPIVEEVHRARRQLLSRAKGDLRKVIDGAVRRQKSEGRAVLEPAPRAPVVFSGKVSKAKLSAI